METTELTADSPLLDPPVDDAVRVTPLNANIGALVEGVQLSDLSDAQFNSVHQALLDHQVIFFHDQHLSEDEHVALARRWGTPMANPVAKLHGDETVLHTVEDTATNPPAADSFHTDLTYWAEPPTLAILCGLDIPPVGGDTLWSSLYAVYDALSDEMKRICQSLRAWHKPTEHFIKASIAHYGEHTEKVLREQLDGALLPLVRTHNETGRQALFMSSFIDHIVGMTKTESDAILKPLFDLVENPNHAVRWRWTEGDVAIWDERCTNHRALSDHAPQYRRMRRCTVEGGRPFYRPDGESQPQIEGVFA